MKQLQDFPSSRCSKSATNQMEELKVNHILGREFTIDRSPEPLYSNPHFNNDKQCCKVQISHGPFIDEWIAWRGSWNQIISHFKTFNKSAVHILSKACWFAIIQHSLSYDYPVTFENNSSNIKQYCKVVKFGLA